MITVTTMLLWWSSHYKLLLDARFCNLLTSALFGLGNVFGVDGVATYLIILSRIPSNLGAVNTEW